MGTGTPSIWVPSIILGITANCGVTEHPFGRYVSSVVHINANLNQSLWDTTPAQWNKNLSNKSSPKWEELNSYGRDLEPVRLRKSVKIRAILMAVPYMRAELTRKKWRLHQPQEFSTNVLKGKLKIKTSKVCASWNLKEQISATKEVIFKDQDMWLLRETSKRQK